VTLSGYTSLKGFPSIAKSKEKGQGTNVPVIWKMREPHEISFVVNAIWITSETMLSRESTDGAWPSSRGVLKARLERAAFHSFERLKKFK